MQVKRRLRCRLNAGLKILFEYLFKLGVDREIEVGSKRLTIDDDPQLMVKFR